MQQYGLNIGQARLIKTLQKSLASIVTLRSSAATPLTWTRLVSAASTIRRFRKCRCAARGVRWRVPWRFRTISARPTNSPPLNNFASAAVRGVPARDPHFTWL